MFNKKRDLGHDPVKDKEMLCDKLHFAGAEAYKLLRTNIQFSFPSDKKCRIIGMTSSARSDGKSITSINLAYSLAETGKRVLLLEADMRLPNIAKRLGLKRSPGLSNILVDMSTADAAIQHTQYMRNFYVVTSGDVPPNPSELLGSSRMEKLLVALSGVFDYIVVDLPPVNIVSDALVVSKSIDGLIFVVRQGRTSKSEVAEAMNQLKLVETKVLGFVLNAVKGKSSSYKYKKYGKYGNGYEYGYGYGYGYGQKRKRNTSGTEYDLSGDNESRNQKPSGSDQA